MMKKRWLAISLLAVLGVLGLCFGCATDVVQETRTVTFMCRGEVYDTQEVLVGEKFTFPTAPESYQLDDDYQNVFLNWTTDPNPNEYRTEGVVAEPEYVYDNLTLYAMFGRRPIDSGDGDSSNVTYRVEFRMPRGEDFGDYSGELIWEDPEGVKRHDDAKLPADNLMPEIEGYHFTGKWEGASLSDVRGNRRVTAVYEKNVYDLVWHYLDETETFRTEFRGEVNLGEKPSVDPAFLFEGWYLDDGFQTEATLDEMPAGNVDLYAKYSIDFSVVTVSQEGTMVYGDADNQFYISGLKDAEGLSYTFAWTVDGKTGEKTASRTYPVKNAGAYHVAVHVFADYKDGLLLDEGDALSGNSESPTMFEIILEKAELSATVTLSANRVVYGDPAPKANATYAGFVFDEDAESVGVGEDFVIMQENEEKSGALHVGNYTVETRPHVLANYKFAPIDPLPFEVTKRALSVSFDVDDYGYGDLFTPQVSFTDFMYEDCPQSLGEHWFTLDGDGRYLGNGTERFSAGEHSAQLFGYASDDYEVTLPAAVSFSVAKRAAYATVSAEGGIYGCTPEVSYTFENVLEDDKANFVPTYTYRRGTGIYSAPHFVVGSYTVGASFEEQGSANYLPVVVTDAAFEITKKPLAVSVSANETYIYGDPIESTLSVVFEDAFVFGEDENTPNLVKKEVRYRYTADGTDYVSSVFKVNEYSVRAWNIEADNYEFSFPETSFKVLKKALTLTVRLQENSILYGATPAPVKDNGADLFNGIEYDGFIAGEGARFVFGNALPVIAYRTAAGAEADTFHAGEYIATTSADPENYQVTIVDAPFTVRPRTLYVDIRLEDGALTYGEKPTASIVYQKDGYDGFFANEQDTLAADAYLEYAGDTVYTTSQLAAIATKMAAGTYAVSVKGIGELADYTVTYREDVSCTVSPKHLTVTLTAGQTKYTYGDTPAVDIAFSPFAYDEDESLFGANASALKYRKDGGKDVYTPATYFGAGAYQVTLEGLVNANYEVEVKDASFDVEKKALTVTVGAQGFTYGDRATPVPTLTYDGFVPEESETVLGGSPVYTYAQAEKAYGKDFFDAGSYTVSVTGYSSDNYAIIYRGGSFNVAKRTASATVTATGGTYGDTPVFGHTQTNIIERDSAGFAFAYKITFTRQSNGSYADYTKSGTYDPAGYYRVTLTYTPNANYNFSVNTAPFTIARKALTVGVSGVAGPYTYGTVPAPKLLFEGFVPEEDASVLSGKPASEFTYYTEGSATTSERRFPVGTWYVAATQGYTSQNYTISYAEKTQFVVSKARLTVTVTADDIIYGQQPRYSAETVGFVYDQTVTNLRGSLTYTVGGERSAAGFYRAGRHTVSASGYSSNNYDFDYVQGTFTVKKAALTVSVTVPDITYGELPAPALSYNGFVSGESASVLSGVPEYTYGGATNAKGYYRVGDHDVSVKGYSSDDYEITYTPSSFHVSPKAITVSVTEEGNFANRTYDSAYALLLASTVNGLVDGDTAELLGTLVCTLNGTRLGDVAADGVLHADSYTFSAGGYTSADYTISYIYGSDGREAVSFTVSPSRVTLTLKDGWTVYGNDTAEPWYTTAGNIYREELTFTVSLQKDDELYTAGSEHHFSVGRYTVTVSHNDNPDYTVSGTPTRTFTVSPRTVTLAVSVDSGEYTYGDTVEISDGIPTSSESILPEDADAVSLHRTVKRNGEAFEENSAPFFPYGTYTVTAEHAANANYTFVGKDEASFTVKKRNFTIFYRATGSRLGEHSSSPTFAEGEPFTFHGTLVLNTNEAGDFSATSEDEFKEHYSWRDGKNGAFYITALFNGAAVDVTENFNVGYSISVILDSSQFNIQIVGTQKFTYDGKDHDIHVEATAAEAVEVKPVIKYSLDKGGNYTEEIPVKFRDAGSYTVYYTVEAENFETLTGEYTVTVDKAAYTVTEPTKDFTYNGTAQGGNVTVKGVTGDTSFKGEVQYNGAHTFTDHKEGGYTVTYSVSGDNNYNNIEGATYTVNINKANPTLTKVDDKKVYTYDKDIDAQVTVDTVRSAVVKGNVYGDETVEYSLDGLSFGTFPQVKDAGSYEITVKVSGANYHETIATYTLTVNKAAVGVPEIAHKTYNRDSQTADVDTAGKFYTVQTNLGGTNAGEYDVVLALTDSDNYKWEGHDGAEESATLTLKFIIDKANLDMSSVEWDYTDGKFTYDTTAHTVALTGLPEFGEIKAAYREAEETNAGEYHAVATLTFDSKNYNDITTVWNLTWKIAKANYTVNVTDDTSYTYNGTAQGRTLDALKGLIKALGDDDFTVSFEGVAQFISAGEHTVTYTVTGNGNYNNIEDASYKVKIAKAKAAIDVSELTFGDLEKGGDEYTYSATYCGTPYDVDWNKAKPADTFNGTLTEEIKITGADAIKNANTYEVTLSLAGNENYEGDTKTYTITINRATPDVENGGASFAYDTQDQHEAVEQNFTATGVFGDIGDEYTVKYQLADGEWQDTLPEIKAAGTYQIKVQISGANYITVEKSFTVTVEKAKFNTESVTNPDAVTYNGTAQGRTEEDVKALIKALGADDFTVEFDGDGQFTDAGEHLVTYKVGGNTNYEDATGTYTVIINKAQATLDVSGITTAYTYTATEQSVNFDAAKATSGIEGATGYGNITFEKDGASITEFKFTNVADGNGVAITVKLADGLNFTGAEEAITLIVNKADYTVTKPSDTTFDYDSTAHGDAVTVSGVDGDESCKGKVTYNGDGKYSFTDANTYTVTYTVSGDDNYNDVTDEYTITINKAKPTLTTVTDDAVYTYDKDIDVHVTEEKVHSAVVKGNVYGDETVEYSLDGSSFDTFPQVKDAKKYTITVKVSGANYVETTATYTFTINKKEVSITVPTEGITVTYDGLPHGEGVTIGTDDAFENVVAEINYRAQEQVSTVAPTFTNAGSYQVRVTATPTNNYTFKDVGDSFSDEYTIIINKAQATLDVSGINTEYTYTATEQSVNLDAAKATSGIEGATGYGKITFEYGSAITEFKFTNVADGNGVEIVIKLEDGLNFTGTKTTISLTVHRAQLEKPTADPTPFTYNKSAQTYTLGGFDGTTMKIEGAELTQTNAGVYQFTVSLSDKTNYEWIDSTQEKLSFTFHIAKAKAVAPDTKPTEVHDVRAKGKTIGEVEQLGEGYHWVEEDAGKELGVEPTVKARAYYNPDSANYENSDSFEVTITTTRTVITVKSDAIYGVDWAETFDEAAFKTWFFETACGGLSAFDIDLDLHSANTKIGSTYLATFTLPAEMQDYYEFSTGEISVDIVFKIKSVDVSGTLYTIEDALHTAGSGTITVKHNTAFATTEVAALAGYTSSHYTVKANVTLLLPYAEGDTTGNKYLSTQDNPDLGGGYAPTKYLTLAIPSGTKVSNLGTITVGAVTGANNTTTPPVGGISAGYSEMQLDGTLNSSGTINVYGNIVGAGTINATAGTVRERFEIYDWPGGRSAAGRFVGTKSVSAFSFAGSGYTESNPNEFPFEQYRLQAINGPMLNVFYGANYLGNVRIYTGEVSTSVGTLPPRLSIIDLTVVTTNSANSIDGLFRLKSGSMFSKQVVGGREKITITGGTDVGVASIHMVIGKVIIVGELKVNMDSSNVRFPIPSCVDITFDGGTTTLPYGYELMGSSADNGTGATVKLINGANVELTDKDDGIIGYSGSSITIGANSKLIVNGTFGAVVKGEEGAQIAVNAEATLSTSGYIGGTGGVSISGTDCECTFNGSETTVQFAPTNQDGTATASEIGTYYYLANKWISPSTEFSVTYHFLKRADGEISAWSDDDGEVLNDNPVIYTPNANIVLNSATTEGWTFIGWFIDADCQTPFTVIEGSILSNIEIYGLFEKVDAYIFTFDTHYTDGAESGITIGSQTVLASEISDFDVSQFKADMQVKDGDTSIMYYFDGWYYNGQPFDKNALPEASGQTTIALTAHWGIKYSVTVGSLSNATVSVNGTPLNQDETLYFMPNTEIKVTADYPANSSRHSLNISPDTDVDGNDDERTFTIKENKTIRASSTTGCFAEGTLITLADGTQKKVEDLLPTDEVLIYNHFTGQYETGHMLFVSHGNEKAEDHIVTNLKFANGTTLRIVESHGLFDLDLNRYVYLNHNNAKDFIGHRFATAENVNDAFVAGETVLTDVVLTNEHLKIYSPMSVWHFDIVAEGMLTITSFMVDGTEYGVQGFVNIFEYEEGSMKYDEAKMQADIEKYGLYTYEDFKDLIPEELFEVCGWKYFKISIGKGYLTWEQVLDAIEYILHSGEV